MHMNVIMKCHYYRVVSLLLLARKLTKYNVSFFDFRQQLHGVAREREAEEDRRNLIFTPTDSSRWSSL